MAATEPRVRVLEGANCTQDLRYYVDTAFGDHKTAFMVKYCKAQPRSDAHRNFKRSPYPVNSK